MDTLVFDADELLTYFEHDMSFVTQLLAMFLPEAERRVQQLKEAAAAADLQALYIPAHTLKGHAATAKTKALGDLAGELVRAVQCGDGEAAIALSARVAEEFEKARSAIAAWQASLPAR